MKEKPFDTELNIQRSFEFKASQHLKEGVLPISWNLVRDYQDIETAKLTAPFHKDFPEVIDLNYEEAEAEELDKKGILHSGYRSYGISPLDERLKFDRGLFDCVGLVIAGIENKKNVSTFIHPSNTTFLTLKEKKNFVRDLEFRLNEVRKRCEEGTIDAVMFGGNYSKKISTLEEISFRQTYLDTINFLTSEVKKVLEFEPGIINGPTPITVGPDSAYYNTPERKLFLVREQVNSGIGRFTASDISR